MSSTQHTSFKGDHKVQFYVLYSVLTHVPFPSLFVWSPFLLKFLLGDLLKIVSCVMTNVIWMSVFPRTLLCSLIPNWIKIQCFLVLFCYCNYCLHTMGIYELGFLVPSVSLAVNH